MLIRTNGKAAVERSLGFILQNPGQVEYLVEYLNDEDPQVLKAAAWVTGHLGEVRPDLLSPYFGTLLQMLEGPASDAVKRNIFRSFQFITIPPSTYGKLFDLCLEHIANPSSAIAVRAFAMTTAMRICKKVPGLAGELIILIESCMDEGSKGFKARGRKCLSNLYRLSS